MGVLLSMVLRSRGISVPLWSEAKWKKTGVGLEGWDRGFSGMAFLVLRCHNCGVNISFGDPTVLVSSTENLLVMMGHGFHCRPA